MKQLLQSLKNGQTEVAEVPCPTAAPGRVLIRTAQTLVSSGTERMIVEFGKGNWIDKARQQPDKVRQVVEKVRTDGIGPTLNAVRSKLNQPIPLGYCNAGEVIAVGAGVTEFKPGDRVASNGSHAEIVSVPVNLCARIPDEVSTEEATFTVAASIALQGIRLVEPQLGECVVVTGLGLIGLLTVQLLRAQGCRVLGIDFDPAKLDMAARFGAETVRLDQGMDPVAAGMEFSRGRGVDAVLITASTDSNDPVRQAAQMCRKRGRIVLVGVAGLHLSRADFFEKELTFQVSCSYGPGRYDPVYEEKGVDYPVGFVRWTEKRNFEAVLDMLAAGSLDVSPLISHHFPIDDVEKAYALITSSEPSLGIILDYPRDEATEERVLRRTVAVRAHEPRTGQPAVAFIGSGNYATAVLIPAFKKANAALSTIASSGGASSAHAARRFGFEFATTDIGEIVANPAIDAVVIATRHDSHAGLVLRAMEAGKHVFVEKPLALTEDEVDRIAAAHARLAQEGTPPVVAVGFNRRFAPQVRKIAELLRATSGRKAFVMTVNSGALPATHWTQDPAVGGGRIIGEACHFIDLLRGLAGHPIVRQYTAMTGDATRDTATIQLEFADGSIGTIHYLSNGNKRFPKERLEVFVDGRVLQLDNFRKLRGFGWPGFTKMNLYNQDKGQTALAEAFVDGVRHRSQDFMPFEEILEVSRATIAAAQPGVVEWQHAQLDTATRSDAA